jgi:hypothetical protein
MVPLVIALCLGGCAGAAPARTAPAPAETARPQAVSRSQLLLEARGRPAEAAPPKDDFIEVDDKKGFLKSWPMVLFVGLIAAAVGAL